MSTDYGTTPLRLPLPDGGDDFEYSVLAASRRVEFAERFRRQGRRIVLAGSFGLPWTIPRLVLADARAINRKTWYRDAEPIDLSGFDPVSTVPHEWWKWRIVVEPKGIAGALYYVDNPVAPGSGGSVMAEDLITADGVLTNLPVPFTAPNVFFSRTGNLQFGYTDDGGTTIYWTDPIWN